MINVVRNKIIEGEYGQAFEIIRTHRLDSNLMVDIDTEGFVQKAREYLSKIRRVDYLNLLISQISDKTSS